MNHSPRALRFSLVIAGTITLLAPACSSRKGFDPTPDEKFPTPDAATADAPPGCSLRCSRDLKSVLEDCGGTETTKEVCADDKACGPGTCVDACAAAAYSKGSVGCEFWTLPADDGRIGRGSCFAAMLANTWDQPVTLGVEYDGKPLDISKSTYAVSLVDDDAAYTLLSDKLAPGQVAVVFLSQLPNVQDLDTEDNKHAPCPLGVTPALAADPIRHGTTKTKAFRLTSDAPISAYSIFPYGGAGSFYPSSTLLLPVSSWEKDYVAVSPQQFGVAGRRTLQIVANEDDTVVRIKPNVEIPSGNEVASAAAGIVQSWTLSRGQVLQFTQTAMTGSPISTTKPVGVFGGSECSNVPEQGFCDLLQQQIPPVSQWGAEYALVPFPPRIDSKAPNVREKVPYTIVGAANGTVLTYEPSRPRDAPEKLEAGQSVSFITDQLLVVKSQDSAHPFYASVYMTGSAYGGGAIGVRVTGDPEFVNLPPSDQFLDRYVFFTDFTFPETRLTIVRRKTERGFLPVELDCAGEISGFTALGTSGEYEYAWVTLTSGFLPQAFSKGSCGYGRQEAHSDGPFSVMVWGMSKDASYGYVGGMGLRPINEAQPVPVE